MKIKKFIWMPRGMRAVLSELFNCTMRTVDFALNFESHSERAKDIRKYAMTHGGIETTKIVR